MSRTVAKRRELSLVSPSTPANFVSFDVGGIPDFPILGATRRSRKCRDSSLKM
jgi:hypothetical protein